MENKNILMFTLVVISTLMMLQTFNPINQEIAIDNQISVTEEYTPAQTQIDTPKIAFSTSSISGKIDLLDGSISEIFIKDYNNQMKEKILFGWQNKLKIADINDSQWIVTKQSEEKIVITQKNQFLDKERTFTFKDKYLIEVTDKVTNITNKEQQFFPYSYIAQKDISNLNDSFLNHEGAVLFTGKSFKELDHSELENKPQTITEYSKWLGFAHQFWLTALIQQSNDKNTAQLNKKTNYIAGFIDYNTSIIEPREVNKKTMLLYVGPKDAQILSQYEINHDIDSLSGVVNWGWLFFATKPMYYIMDWLIDITQNPVLSIFLIVIMLKIVLFPIAYKGQVMTIKMQKISPKIEEIKQKYSNDMQKMSAEISKLYKKHDINLIMSIFPLLIQIPILFAVYRVMHMLIGFRNAPFLWITDLSSVDQINLLGFLEIKWITITMLGLIAGTAMMLQIVSSQESNVQRTLLMTIFMSFLLSGLPSGALLYMVINGVTTSAQQLIIKQSLINK